MPWTTPDLRRVREMVRDDVTSMLRGSAATGNRVLRVMADAMANLAHMTLRYVAWGLLQMLPTTAEAEWLRRHGDIWLRNSDGTRGEKKATYSAGAGTATGLSGTIVPQFSRISGPSGFALETVEEIVLGAGPTQVAIRALDAGATGNFDPGTRLSLDAPPPGVDGSVVVVSLSGGTDAEATEDLRGRVLERIQKPPMGGAAHDYERWAKEIPAVTRAWLAPNAMGRGTWTLRFMMDALRADNDGFPLPQDEEAVAAYLDTKRPVTTKDRWVVSPLREPIAFVVRNLDPDTTTNRAALEDSVRQMLQERARPSASKDGVLLPAQTIYHAWVSEAISRVSTIDSFDLDMADHAMPSGGHMGVMGTVTYG
jgi:uncharacterized phage protein gp47/JayE